MQIETILYPTDFSDSADIALDYAVFLARKFKAQLLIFHCDEFSSMIDLSGEFGYRGPYDLREEVEKVTTKSLQSVSAKIPKDIRTEVVLSTGRAYDQIVLNAQKAQLIVMGTHGRSHLANYFLGSNAERVVRHSGCPVLTIREKAKAHNFRKIIFGVDFSMVTRQVLPQAVGLAREFDADLILAHIETEGIAVEVIEDSFKMLFTEIDLQGIRMNTEIRTDSNVYQGLNLMAAHQGADLLIIGTHGHGSQKRASLGSKAADIVNHSSIPVLTFPLITN